MARAKPSPADGRLDVGRPTTAERYFAPTHGEVYFVSVFVRGASSVNEARRVAAKLVKAGLGDVDLVDDDETLDRVAPDRFQDPRYHAPSCRCPTCRKVPA